MRINGQNNIIKLDYLDKIILLKGLEDTWTFIIFFYIPFMVLKYFVAIFLIVPGKGPVSGKSLTYL